MCIRDRGCTYPDLRTRSAEFVQQFDADGYAIGGLAVGEPAPVMYEMIELVNGILPIDRPRYLMGVGTPVNLLEAIERGVDMFDCVMPTRNGRNGMLFTSEGIILSLIHIFSLLPGFVRQGKRYGGKFDNGNDCTAGTFSGRQIHRGYPRFAVGVGWKTSDRGGG